MSLARALALLSALTCAGCDGGLQGELIGTYKLSMHVADNSCGKAALPVPDGAKYAVELRADGPRGFWRRVKVPPVEGVYDAGTFRFSFEALFDLGQADAGTAGCRLYRNELLTGEVILEDDAGRALHAGDPTDAAASDAGVAPAPTTSTLRGTYSYSFRTDPTGICKDQPGPLGVYEHLPCSVDYTLDGEPQKPF